ncbi:MAG: DUF4287 domain-containing protein [Chloroflexi bacterium]|nr:DUF4287 domain-containing protein [Chloroflexota bacterium]MBI5713918.1 DUF4287 domain-containing protein [Chloroflexota bacterium]
MPTSPKTKTKKSEPKRMSDEAVKAKTGKNWKEWFTIIDKAGGRKKTHQEIVTYLRTKHKISDWWQQMVTVVYEQARGKRVKHQTSKGFQVGGNKTINVPIATLYKAWITEGSRRPWLPHSDITIRKSMLNKSMRLTWVDGKTHVDVQFYEKDGSKSQVTLEHSKLPNTREANRMKAYWARALTKLKETIEI